MDLRRAGSKSIKILNNFLYVVSILFYRVYIDKVLYNHLFHSEWSTAERIDLVLL